MSFYDLTPERVLAAVESTGLLCTGRCMALNSFENRVYDVELELDEIPVDTIFRPDRRIVKFYRPGRWTEEQILEEHQFLADLHPAEIPAIAPLPFPDGKTFHRDPGSEIYFAVFPKVGGRAPDELTDEQLIRVGRLLARIHTVGAARPAQHRMAITPETYGLANLQFLLEGRWIPIDFEKRYQAVVNDICRISQADFAAAQSSLQRLHGDCHLGNLLWNSAGPFFVDFDDMVIGPPVQDIWLLVPGRDAESLRQREVLLEGYSEFRSFDRRSLRLVEPLRALRFIHYSAWIARRWEDPSFPQAFPHFGTHQYWTKEVEDLEEQVRIIQQGRVQG